MNQNDFPTAQQIRDSVSQAPDIRLHLDEILEGIQKTRMNGDSSYLYSDNTLTTAHKVAIVQFLDSKGFKASKASIVNGVHVQW